MLPDKQAVGKAFKKSAKILQDHLASLDETAALALKDQLAAGPVTLTLEGHEFPLTKDIITIQKATIKEHERKFTPSVIEPSFGIGRIIYSLLEHTFATREGDEQRTVHGRGWFACAFIVCPGYRVYLYVDCHSYLVFVVAQAASHYCTCQVLAAAFEQPG